MHVGSVGIAARERGGFLSAVRAGSSQSRTGRGIVRFLALCHCHRPAGRSVAGSFGVGEPPTGQCYALLLFQIDAVARWWSTLRNSQSSATVPLLPQHPHTGTDGPGTLLPCMHALSNYWYCTQGLQPHWRSPDGCNETVIV